jgi:hypothetical protein
MFASTDSGARESASRSARAAQIHRQEERPSGTSRSYVRPTFTGSRAGRASLPAEIAPAPPARRRGQAEAPSARSPRRARGRALDGPCRFLPRRARRARDTDRRRSRPHLSGRAASSGSATGRRPSHPIIAPEAIGTMTPEAGLPHTTTYPSPAGTPAPAAFSPRVRWCMVVTYHESGAARID